MARGLGLSVTAEVVDPSKPAERLRQIGGKELQGYFSSCPKPASDLEVRSSPMLERWNYAPAAAAVTRMDLAALF